MLVLEEEFSRLFISLVPSESEFFLTECAHRVTFEFVAMVHLYPDTMDLSYG